MSTPKLADELYEDTVDVERVVSAIAGPGVETTTFAALRSHGGILAAFADDIDIQEITVVSTNLGTSAGAGEARAAAASRAACHVFVPSAVSGNWRST